MQRSIIRTLFLSGILTAFFVAGACAAHIERLPESSDYSTISAMKNDIVDEVNAIAEEGAEQAAAGNSDVDFTQPITTSDIDWNAVYKNYVDSADVMSSITSTTSLASVKKQVQYEWIVPLRSGNVDLYVLLAQTPKLSEALLSKLPEDQAEEIRNEAGKWSIHSVSVGALSADAVESELGEAGRNAQEVLLFGGTNRFRYEFTVLQQADGSLSVQLLDEDPYVDTEDSVSANSADGVQWVDTADSAVLQTGMTYPAEEFAAYLNTREVETGLIGGGVSPKQDTVGVDFSEYLLLGILAAVTFGMGCLGFAVKKTAG